MNEDELRESLAKEQQRTSMLYDALDHIVKTARASRTNTRRLRWIEQRALVAMRGEFYTDSAFDLVRYEDNEHKRLVRQRTEKAVALRDAVNMLREALKAILGEDQDLDTLWQASDPESFERYQALRAKAWPDGQGEPLEVR